MIATYTIQWAAGTTTTSTDIPTSYGDEPLYDAQQEIGQRLTAEVAGDMADQIRRAHRGPTGDVDLTTRTPWVAQHHGPDGTTTLTITAR